MSLLLEGNYSVNQGWLKAGHSGQRCPRDPLSGPEGLCLGVLDTRAQGR